MRRPLQLLALLLACLCVGGDTRAGLFRRRPTTACQGGVCPRPAVQPRPVAPRPVVYATPQQGAALAPDAAAFLQALNLWRASRGVGPASWDAGLAAYAATNRHMHDPASHPNSSQCWSPVRSWSQSLAMWVADPPHASILLSGTTVGASVCESGLTANVR